MRTLTFPLQKENIVVTTMNIKDPMVREPAMQLAARRGTSATGAIRQALIETLQRDATSREGLAERLMALGRESAALPEMVLTDDDLHDERGLPRSSSTPARSSRS